MADRCVRFALRSPKPWVAFSVWAALALSCASGPEVCRRDPVTGSERCQRSSGDYGEAAVTAAAAAGTWAAVGCTVNGCEMPFRCNAETKMCERIRCDEGGSSCPPGYLCDPQDHLCK